MATTNTKYSRFDARLPNEQKSFFEKAAIPGGYRNLTDFIVQAAVQEKAKEIMKEWELIIASERNCEVFFTEVKKNLNIIAILYSRT